MQIKVDKKDLEKLQKKLTEDAIDEILTKAMTELGDQTLAVAKKNTPVDSGQLRHNWYVARVNSERVELKNETSYAEYVEYGHRQEPGTYVPKIGKRLTSYWVHGKFFAQRTEETMRKRMPGIIKPVVIKELKRLIDD